jgi:signal transduction histidine kinase
MVVTTIKNRFDKYYQMGFILITTHSQSASTYSKMFTYTLVIGPYMRIYHYHRIWLTALSLFFTVQSAMTQTPDWRMWTNQDGLTGTEVVTVRVGPSGNIYISQHSYEEICVLDGYEIKRIPAPNARTEVLEGAPGELWAPYNQEPELFGVKHYIYPIEDITKGKWASYIIQDVTNANYHDPKTLRIQQDYTMHRWGKLLPLGPDKILVLTPEKLLEFHASKQISKMILHVNDTPLNRFEEIAPSKDDNIWIVGHKNIIKLNKKLIQQNNPPSFTTILKNPLDENTFFKRFYWQPTQLPVESDHGKLFMPAKHLDDLKLKLATIKNGHLQWITPSEGKTVLLGCQDVDDCYRILEYDGYNHLYTFTRYNKNHEIEEYDNKGKWFLAVESNGIFWMRSHGGLVRYTPSIWRKIPAMKELSLAYGIDDKGTIWSASWSALHHFKGGEWTTYSFPTDYVPSGRPPKTSWHMHEICFLHDGRVVIPTTGACQYLLLFNPKTELFEIVEHADETRRTGEFLRQRNDGTVWIVSCPKSTVNFRDSRLEIYDGKIIKPCMIEGEYWDVVHAHYLLESSSGDIWIGDHKGLGLYRNGQFRYLDKKSGFPGETGLTMAELNNGNIWIGDDSNIYEYDGINWTTIKEGIQDIEYICQSSDGDIWVTSQFGLHRFHNNLWIDYTEKEGITNTSTLHVFEDPQNNIWLSARVNGLFRYHPEADLDPPRVYIDPVDNVSRLVPGGDARFVFYGKDKWKFTYSDRLLYSHRIDNGIWSAFKSEPFAYYKNFQSGSHNFEVRAMDRNGNISITPARLNFSVDYPWYRQPFFLFTIIISSLIIIILLCSHLYHYFKLEQLVALRTNHLSQANQQLQENQNKLRKLAQELSITEERERRQIATDLHDQIGQSLALCKIQTQTLHASYNGTGLENELIQLRDTIHQTIQDTRSLTFEISPPVLYEIGLTAAVSWLARNLHDKFGLEIIVSNNNSFENLDEDLRSFLFRAIRECIINAIKHAQAKKVLVRLEQNEPNISITIEDNGVGMKEESERSTKGFGLFAIQERLRLLGGNFTINSKLGEGTRIHIILISNQKKDLV